MRRMLPVESSCLSEVGYDPAGRRLYVRFLESGEVYAYLEVEEALYRELLRADSKGEYFNSVIKPNHPFRRLGER